jgi:hypothetical protein
MEPNLSRSKRLARILAFAGLAVMLPVGSTLFVQAAACASGVPTYVFAALAYCFPSTQGVAGSALTNDGDGNLTWAAAAPPDVVTFSITGSCPSGWTEFTAGRGRYIVGLPNGGTNAAIVGTALANLENRSVGQHTHSVTDPGHNHTQDAHAHSSSDGAHAHSVPSFASSNIRRDISAPVTSVRLVFGSAAVSNADANVSLNNATAVNQAAASGISLANAGSVTGTNAPYVQLIMCRSVTGS